MARAQGQIAVFDSGLGGISVLRELVRQMPHEQFLYFGDSANAPYGTKSTAEVQACTRTVVKYLLGRGIKALVIACNTATGATKMAKVETGYEVRVPLFVNEGDTLRIDTRTGNYVERVAA